MLDLYKINSTSQTALALGKISLISIGNNEYKIKNDEYDFNIEWQNGLSKRNIATFGAEILHYSINPTITNLFGGPYKIIFHGTINIKP